MDYLLKSMEIEKSQNSVMSAGDVGVVSYISAEASVGILAGFEPSNDLVSFGLG